MKRSKLAVVAVAGAILILGVAALAAQGVKTEVKSDRAPKAVGPYAQAITAGGFVFCSGQIPLDPATGKLVEGGIEAQTRQVLTNLKAVLEAAGSSLDQVVKCTVMITDMADFAAMNKVYAEFFKAPFPARATFQVAGLAMKAMVEIDCIAIKP
jgi:2-iminobutanoate/2-iminopropanoate deaminase